MNPISSLDTQPTHPISTSSHREHCAQCSSLGKLDGEILEAQSTLNRLEFEVCETKSRLERLLGERKAMKAKLNAVHDRLTTKLPLELIAWIFRFCLPDDDGSTPPRPSKSRCRKKVILPPIPLLLGSVSKMWRDIAWSIPHLWTCMSVHLRSAYDPCQLDAASAWLRRSKMLPLAVHIKNARSRTKSKSVDPIILLINQHSSRWRNVTLTLPASLLAEVRGDGGGAPILQTLYISTSTTSSRRVPQHLLLDNVNPSPTRVDVQGLSFSATKIDWVNATHVRFEGLHVAECLALFQAAPRMVACKLSSTTAWRHNGAPPNHHIPNQPFIHHLLTFDLKMLNGESPDVLFEALALPSLDILTYHDARSFDLDVVRLSLERWGCYVTALCLDEVKVKHKELVQLLRAPPFLHLESLSLSDFTVTTHFLSLLSETPKLQIMRSQGHFLPRLRSLSFSVLSERNFSWGDILSLFPSPTGDIDTTAQNQNQRQRIRPQVLQQLKIVLNSRPRSASRIDSSDSARLLEVIDNIGVDLSLKVEPGGRDLIEEMRNSPHRQLL
ncbi:hypothetical protein NLJ89_g1375 [Agrocybe chaxingu]|uniref:F-box domain-containing protein n=1 Tax=Agrocybe chaxingu TaxID=84603 RepID=A0A9W8TDF5_9AGAR|nr:hypothetical protein NLJ89_g1375 [Agrocybe chaxingu]